MDKNQDPGSGINISDPQHCQQQIWQLLKLSPGQLKLETIEGGVKKAPDPGSRIRIRYTAWNQRGGATLARGWGGRKSQFRRLERKPGALYTLCSRQLIGSLIILINLTLGILISRVAKFPYHSVWKCYSKNIKNSNEYWFLVVPIRNTEFKQLNYRLRWCRQHLRWTMGTANHPHSVFQCNPLH